MNAAETQGKLRAGGRSFLCRPRPVGGGVPIWHDAYRGERAGDFDGFPRYQVEQGNGKPPLVITGGRAVFHWAGIIDRLKGAFTSIPANFRPPERKRRVDTRMSRATPTMCRSFRGGFARALPKGGSYCFRRAKSLLAPVRVRQIARPGRLRNNPYSRRAVKNRTRSPTRARIGSGRPFVPPALLPGDTPEGGLSISFARAPDGVWAPRKRLRRRYASFPGGRIAPASPISIRELILPPTDTSTTE